MSPSIQVSKPRKCHREVLQRDHGQVITEVVKALITPYQAGQPALYFETCSLYCGCTVGRHGDESVHL